MSWPPKSIADFIEHGDRLAKLIEFADEMQRLRVLSNTGGALLRRSPATKSYALDQRGTQEGALPSIADQAGLVLGTDGVTTSWVPNGATLFTHVRRTATQSIPNVSDTAVSYDTAVSNEFGLWSATNPTRITIPEGKGGLYQFFGQNVYAINGTGVRYVYLVHDGAAFGATDIKAALAGDQTYISIDRPQRMDAGAVMECFAWQSSGAPLNLTSSDFFAMRIGD